MKKFDKKQLKKVMNCAEIIFKKFPNATDSIETINSFAYDLFKNNFDIVEVEIQTLDELNTIIYYKVFLDEELPKLCLIIDKKNNVVNLGDTSFVKVSL